MNPRWAGNMVKFGPLPALRGNVQQSCLNYMKLPMFSCFVEREKMVVSHGFILLLNLGERTNLKGRSGLAHWAILGGPADA